MSPLIVETPSARAAQAPGETLVLRQDWTEALAGAPRRSLIATLQQWLPARRWFRGKARGIKSLAIREQITVPMADEKAFLLLFEVSYTEGEPEMYVLPLACALGEGAAAIRRQWPQSILLPVSLHRSQENGVLYDAIVSKEFCRALLALTAFHHTMKGETGEIEAEPTRVLRRVRRENGLDIEPKVSKAEQSNSSVIYGNSIILKFFRRLDIGLNPELEIERFLAARNFPHSPALAGALEYRDHDGHTATMAVLTSFVPGCHDAWEDTLAALVSFYETVEGLPAQPSETPQASEAESSRRGPGQPPKKPVELIGSYLEDARTLGQRTAALHLALASEPADPAFRPEPWTVEGQQALVESLQSLARQNFQLLRQRLADIPPESQALAEQVLPLESLVAQRFNGLGGQAADAVRIRTHGDYHLGQVLHHGDDFLIIDFEGEPAISLEQRRAKQSALRDVAGMIYSFFYAANAALRERPASRLAHSDAGPAWARYWSVWVGTTFLRAYLETAKSAPFLPADPHALKAMLDVELLRKAIYELGYELNNRPDWLRISCQVLLDLLNSDNPI
ncbi:MAG TPA: putative maltokinase [Candidatus Acidoferrales bacterium]|nr:putative maltokinase [Candidatus Acidoferrales bacterium]